MLSTAFSLCRTRSPRCGRWLPIVRGKLAPIPAAELSGLPDLAKSASDLPKRHPCWRETPSLAPESPQCDHLSILRAIYDYVYINIIILYYYTIHYICSFNHSFNASIRSTFVLPFSQAAKGSLLQCTSPWTMASISSRECVERT